MMHSNTIEEYKRLNAEIDTTPILQQIRVNLSNTLNSILNQEPVQKLAFGTRFLWEMIAGNNNYGRVLQAVVFAHQPQVNGRNKLKVWYGDRFYFWHTAEKFAVELNMSVPTVRRAIKRLTRLGLITYRIMKDDFGITCYHIALEFDVFFNFVEFIVKRLDYKAIDPLLYRRKHKKRKRRSRKIYFFQTTKKIQRTKFGILNSEFGISFASTSRFEPRLFTS